MAKQVDNRIVETATEARQAELGPSILLLLTASFGLAIIVMAAVYVLFFKN